MEIFNYLYNLFNVCAFSATFKWLFLKFGLVFFTLGVLLFLYSSASITFITIYPVTLGVVLLALSVMIWYSLHKKYNDLDKDLDLDQ